jgi:pyruvate dehydrogenase E2 component (dihydrolipoamide acetyltransferase)
MSKLVSVTLPDIGDFHDVEVVEVMVKPGDKVRVDDSLITIESDKASMEVPSTAEGVIKELKVKVGDKVSEGSAIIVVETAEEGADESEEEVAAPAPPVTAAPARAAAPAQAQPRPVPSPAAAAPAPAPSRARAESAAAAAPSTAKVIPIQSAPQPSEPPIVRPHASPAVRKFARELGVDLTQIHGTGISGRIFRSDVQQFVKEAMKTPRTEQHPAAPGLDLIAWPKVDFTRFGEIETRPLNRIRRLSKTNLARNWVMIPHVTQFDEADVTDLEAFRNAINAKAPKNGVRLTLLAFVLKALVPALKEFPEFNSSLEGDNLILKKYFHFAFAADTPEGLLVPVIHDVDKKGVLEIATETAALAARAREGKLRPADIQGGCITVSSLGGIGGTAFTPIINAPEVAVLGISRVAHKPVWRDGAFVPRLMVPLSLSYDHRVIDGALAARFITYFGTLLDDMRRALL